MKQNQEKQGFTIIEVVLVLAIAGLIFLIVFLAVPALQRSQRDTQRRSDMGRFMSQITQYQSNNGGQVPTTNAELSAFESSYMEASGDTFTDPSGTDYNAVVSNKSGIDDVSNNLARINYFVDASCGTGGDVVDGNGDRDIAITLKLEGGGAFCQDNGGN